MSDRHWFIVGRWQEYEGEAKANLLRTIGIGAFYTIELLDHHSLRLGWLELPKVAGVDDRFHQAVTALAVAWVMTSLAAGGIVGLTATAVIVWLLVRRVFLSEGLPMTSPPPHAAPRCLECGASNPPDIANLRDVNRCGMCGVALRDDAALPLGQAPPVAAELNAATFSLSSLFLVTTLAAVDCGLCTEHEQHTCVGSAVTLDRPVTFLFMVSGSCGRSD